MSRREDYLWDGTGPPDPEVRKLERALSPLRHRDQPPVLDAVPAAAGKAPPRPTRWLWWSAAAAALIGAWWAGSTWLAPAPAVRLTVAESGEVLAVGQQRHVTGRAEVLTMETRRRDGGEFEWTGELTLAEGSHLVVESLSQDQTDLRLERGQMDAFVGVHARPGFFRVGTPAATCVDLGCQYTLTVDDAGNAHVEVVMGQVAFRNIDGGEVLVLAGATCLASPDRGAGTPRYSESPPALRGALDAFDGASAPEARLSAARSVVREAALADEQYDALPLWHLLGDPDTGVAAMALHHLEARFDTPEGLIKGQLPDARGKEIWKAHLHLGW